MRSTAIVLIVLLAAGSLAVTASAGGIIQGHNCPHCGHHQPCPAVPVTIKEKKHCWQVECKNFCIPPIKWPWDHCCEPGCGKVKTVKVLKKIEYECARCGYEWEAPSVCCECGK
ncbi:MAG TPA: hypothetical protein VFV87_16360 [Pirellulaceae bacterium]|nr:hypothetical protein [Pirellulaceae bacterium]